MFITDNHEEPWRVVAMEQHALSNRVIGLALEVHKAVGPSRLPSFLAAFYWQVGGTAPR